MKKNVLIVEKDDSLRRALARRLRQADYEVSEEGGSNVAYAMHVFSPDTIVLNVHDFDGGENGATWVEHCRRQGYRGAFILLDEPRQFASAEVRASSEAAQKLRDGSIVQILVKPLDGQHLEHACARSERMLLPEMIHAS